MKVETTCKFCSKKIQKDKRHLKWAETRKLNVFCNVICKSNHYKQAIEITCSHCNTMMFRPLADFRKSKSGLLFCSRSCSATYNNTHKTQGTRRSKLEVWLETKLNELYPLLDIVYCDKTTINSELDIYIPSLRLAFELNGIYHYEPIHGQSKLNQVQNNDSRKFQACLEKDIELVIIDTSSLKYFKEHNCQKYLDIIKNITDLKVEQERFELP